jgi:ribonuclease HI
MFSVFSSHIPKLKFLGCDNEAILKGLQLLYEVKAKAIEIFGDSQLIINQLLSLYECKDDILRKYYEDCRKLLDYFPSVVIEHVPRNHNQEANRLAQSASRY